MGRQAAEEFCEAPRAVTGAPRAVTGAPGGGAVTGAPRAVTNRANRPGSGAPAVDGSPCRSTNHRGEHVTAATETPAVSVLAQRGCDGK